MSDNKLKLQDAVLYILICAACATELKDKFGESELAEDADDHGWRVQDGDVFCPSCADED